MSDEQVPFWKRKTLEDMNRREWEALCDGCGRCCLLKVDHPETGVAYSTSVACHLLDTNTCRCTDYPTRWASVPDCIVMTPKRARTLPWLPPTCAYRMVAKGEDLEWWHPLVSGSDTTVHLAMVSVREMAISEADVHPEDLLAHMLEGWSE